MYAIDAVDLYLVVEDDQIVRAIQPYFVVDQDLLAGVSVGFKTVLVRVRRLWPRFMHARTLMVGCAAGEGHLDGDDATQAATADALGRSLSDLARRLNCALIVLKEFPARYRAPLHCLHNAGFVRVPSMPMTTLNIDYKSFEDYLANSLSPRTRGKVRRKLRAAERAEPAITMEVVTDATPCVDDIYPLYERYSNARRFSSKSSQENSCASAGFQTRSAFSYGIRAAISSRSACVPCRATVSATNM